MKIIITQNFGAMENQSDEFNGFRGECENFACALAKRIRGQIWCLVDVKNSMSAPFYSYEELQKKPPQILHAYVVKGNRMFDARGEITEDDLNIFQEEYLDNHPNPQETEDGIEVYALFELHQMSQKELWQGTLQSKQDRQEMQNKAHQYFLTQQHPAVPKPKGIQSPIPESDQRSE